MARKKVAELQGQLAEAGAQVKAEADEEVAKAKGEADKLASEASSALRKARAAYKEEEQHALTDLTKQIGKLAVVQPKGDPAAGKKLFLGSAGCSGCHTYAPAGSTAKVGPDLDNLAADAKKANHGTIAEYARDIWGLAHSGASPAASSKEFSHSADHD